MDSAFLAERLAPFGGVGRAAVGVLAVGVLAVVLAGLCGCHPQLAPTQLNAVAPAVAAPANKRVEPVVVGLAPGGLTRLCDGQLNIAKRQFEAIRTLDPQRHQLSWENTLEVVDDLALSLDNAGSFPHLMGVAHPDQAVREAARKCEIAIDDFTSSLYLDEGFANVVRAYAKTKPQLSPEQSRLLNQLVRDLRRSGMDLPATKRARVQVINRELSELGQQFSAGLNGSYGYIELPPEHLAGLSESYRAGHPPNQFGMVRISTEQSDYFPFIKHARERNPARELYVKFVNRGGEENVKRLEQVLMRRREKAVLLGYRSWADYALETRLVGSEAQALAFVERVRAATRPLVAREFEQFRSEWRRLGQGHRSMASPDLPYVREHLKLRQFGLDDNELAQYFEFEQVTQGLFAISQRMFGISFQRLAETAWHPSVRVYQVRQGEDTLGKVYLDMFARDAKYQHAAMFPIRTSKKLADGSWQRPIAALVCNFAEPGEPMPHDEVVTYFHEFGHLLHDLFATPRFASFAGIKTAQDFDETPAQLFEQWAYDAEVLALFARHRRSKQPLPKATIRKLRAARRVGIGLHTERQLLLASVDLRYHSQQLITDSSDELEKIYRQHSSFQHVPGTHLQSSFSHLIGYDAGYYGYQFALTLVHEALARFQREGMLNPRTAGQWRKLVLAPGASQDERSMIAAFVGHAPNEGPYLNYLTAKKPADR